MKYFIFITLAVLCITGHSTLNAQEKKFPMTRTYMFGAFGPAGMDASGSSWGISSVFNNKWIATYGSLRSSRPTQLPPDFQYQPDDPGWLGLLLFPLIIFVDDSGLENRMQFNYLSFGRYYPVSRKFSFILDGGLGLATQQGYNFYRKGLPVKYGEQIVEGVSSNYTVTAIEKSSVGGIVRGGVDWAFAGFAGMGLDLYYNLNAGGIDDNFGLNLRFMIGYMPRPPKRTIRY